MPHKSPSTRTVALIIVGLCVVFAVGAYSLGVMRMKSSEAEAKPTITQTEPEEKPVSVASSNAIFSIQTDEVVLGAEDAPVTIVEYSSLSCSHCAHFHNDVLPDLQKKYIDTGKVKLVVRPFPLNAPALKGAQLVACAPKTSRVQFIKVLFEMQEDWAYTAAFMEPLKHIAAVGGVDAETFDGCMNNKAIEETILSEQKKASDTLQIAATPTFFMNGELVKVAPDSKDFSAAIDALLSK